MMTEATSGRGPLTWQRMTRARAPSFSSTGLCSLASLPRCCRSKVLALSRWRSEMQHNAIGFDGDRVGHGDEQLGGRWLRGLDGDGTIAVRRLRVQARHVRPGGTRVDEE